MSKQDDAPAPTTGKDSNIMKTANNAIAFQVIYMYMLCFSSSPYPGETGRLASCCIDRFLDPGRILGTSSPRLPE